MWLKKPIMVTPIREQKREMRSTSRCTKHSPEKITVDQPESLNKWNQKVTDLKEKELKQHRLHLSKEKQSQSKEMKTDSDGVHDKNKAAGPVKTDKEPPSKQQKIQRCRRPVGQQTHFQVFPQFKSIKSSALSLLHSPTLTSIQKLF